MPAPMPRSWSGVLALVCLSAWAAAEETCQADTPGSESCEAGAEGGEMSRWDMTGEQFVAAVHQKDHLQQAVFAMWHSPSCGHCKRLAPDFMALAEAFEGEEKVKVVMIDAKANPELAAQHNVKGYPTLQLFHSTTQQDPTVCKTRTRRGMARFLNEHLGLAVHMPTVGVGTVDGPKVVDATDSFETLLDEDQYVVVLWRTSSKQSDLATPEYERVARWYSRDADGSAKVVVTQVAAEDRQDLVNKFDVQTFPAITLHHGDDPHVTYEMDQKMLVVSLSSVKIAQFIATHTQRRESPLLPPSPTQTCTDAVDHLTPDTFDTYVAAHEVTMVEFFAPWCGHCKNLATQYNKVAKTFRRAGTVGIAAVDADEHKELANRYDVSGYPTIRVFSGSVDESVVYDGEQTLEAMVAHVNDKAATNYSPIVTRGSMAVQVTGDNLDDVVLNPDRDVLILFYAPWCPHCKKALPEFEMLAATLARTPDANVTIAMMDAEKHKQAARTYGGTHRYPTVEYFPRGDKSGMTPWVYMSPIQADHMLAYIDEQTGGHTVLCAGLGDRAGVEEGLTPLLTQAWVDQNYEMAAGAVAGRISSRNEHGLNAKVYSKVLRKMASKGDSYVEKEVQRLDKMLEGDSVPNDRVASMKRRRNILGHVLSCRPSS